MVDSKEIAKYAGKIVATIVSPPLGGPLWFKGRNKVLGVLGGIIVSVNISVRLNPYISRNEVYDNPLVKVERKVPETDMDVLPVLEAFSCPLAFYFHNPKKTIVGEDTKCVVFGDDVINFQNETGKYVLNFGHERRFGDTYEGTSVQKAREKLRNYVNKGNIPEARKAKSELDEIIESHNQIRQVLKETVKKMNSELEGLAENKPVNPFF